MAMTSTAPAPTVARAPGRAAATDLGAEVVGRDEQIPLLDGRLVRYVNLDNAASTPAFRGVARTRRVCVRADADGTLDEEDLDRRLREHAGRVALLAVSGASNVTGVIPAVHRLAEKVHAAGGRILVDAAQLAPHRAIDMRAHDDPGHLDFVAMSAHKLYAPFGSGALVGPRDAFTTRPDHSGGGTINLVTLDDVVWANLPDREEAGTPNVLGAIAFAAATSILEDIGFARIAADEAELTRHALSRLARVPSVTVYGPTGPAATDASRRLGVVSFGVDGLDHAYVAAVLGYEHGIGVRSGCFCAEPYIAHLLRLSAGARARWLELARRNDHRSTPGLVRISFGCYNDITDVDRAVDALEQAVVGGRGTYHAVRDGSFVPASYYEPALFHLSDPQCAARTLGT